MDIGSLLRRSLASIIVLSLATAVAGQEAATAKATPAQDKTDKTDGFREQTIYIPYGKLPEVFEKQGRGVFIPYAKFQELWKAARQQVRKATPEKLPVDAVIQELDSQATIGDEVVSVTATAKIDILGKGWITVPLRLAGSAISRAQIDGKPARLVADKSGHWLLLHNPAEQATQVVLQLEYARSYEKKPGQSSVTFQSPQAPINRWRIRIPEAGMAVKVEPMIAASQAPAADGDADGPRDLLAFVGATPSVRITWNPKAEGASGLAAFATVQAEHQTTISEGVIRSTILMRYSISRATLSQLLLEVPADQKVVNVFDGNVKRWQVQAADNQQQIQVDLFEPTQGNQTLVMELEQFRETGNQAYEVQLPVVRAVGVARQQGTVVARLDSGLRAEATGRTGLLQLDQNDLPTTLRGKKWDFSYRYGAVPYTLRLRLQKIQPRVTVHELVDAELTSSQLLLNWQGRFQIEDAGLFQLHVDIPPGFDVRSIQGKALPGCKAAAVDSYHQIDKDKPTWRVNLSQKAMGKVGLIVQLRKSLSEPDLLTPTGKSVAIAVPLPRATASSVEFSEGTLVVAAPESLRINPGDTKGLRSISFGEAYQQIKAAPRSGGQVAPILAYAYTKGDADLSVNAERRRPQVIVRQLLQAEIESGVVKFHARLFYDVKYSGVEKLRVDVPTDLAAEIRKTTSGLRKDEITPAPDDVAEGYTAWSFAGETELLGKVQVQLEWEQKIDELGIGKSQTIDLPRLIPMDVDRATGQIVISKSESIDVQPEGTPDGLIPIDPQGDLMPEAKIEAAAMAFEYVGPWEMTLRATRYELESSKLTSVERGVARVVALSQGELSVQVLYRLRSARQRLAIDLPAGASFDAQPLRINGQPVTPERESATTIYAPLVDMEADTPFVMELRYNVEATPKQIVLPSFPDDPPVQKVYLCVYLPPRQVLLKSDGPWTDEGETELFSFSAYSSVERDSELVQWVCADQPSGLSSAMTFPIGKSQLFVYSTLRPEAGKQGALKLNTARRNVVHGAVIAVLALLGLPLFRRPLRWQLSFLLLVTGALLVATILVPEFGRTVIGGVLLAAVGVLILVWLIGHLQRLRHVRWPALSRPATTGPTAVPSADGPDSPTTETTADEPSADADKATPAAVDESPADDSSPPEQTPDPDELSDDRQEGGAADA